jgi:hypothetical protein
LLTNKGVTYVPSFISVNILLKVSICLSKLALLPAVTVTPFFLKINCSSRYFLKASGLFKPSLIAPNIILLVMLVSKL